MITTLISSLILFVAPLQSLALLPPSFTCLRPTLKQSIRSSPQSGIGSVLQASKISNNNDDDNDNNKKKQRRPKWITCSTTKEMIYAIQQYVRQDDNVAELGSQLREVSRTICESIQKGKGSAVLVDVHRNFPKEASDSRTNAMRRAGDDIDFYPECAKFYEIPQLDDWRQAFFFGQTTATTDNNKQYDILVLDVNSIVGNDLEWTTLAIIREFLAMNPCRLVLVKSLSLNQWASRLVHGQKWIRQGGISAAKASGDNKQNVHNDTSNSLSKIVATVGVQEYRNTIPYTVRPGDRVLEIGCHLGTSTALIHETVKTEKGYCMGVDIGSKIIKGAQKRYPELFFQIGDAWRTAALLRIQQEFLQRKKTVIGVQQEQQTGFEVLYVDVGGLSGQDGVLEALSLISALSNALEPRAIVIKSQCMRRLSSTLVPYWQVQKHKRGEPKEV